MTEEEFIKHYCQLTGLSWNDIKDRWVPMPCICDEQGCMGWAMVSTLPVDIGVTCLA